MNALHFVSECTERGKPGVLVWHLDKGISTSMPEQLASEKTKQILEQWSRAMRRDGAMHWFFEYRH